MLNLKSDNSELKKIKQNEVFKGLKINIKMQI